MNTLGRVFRLTTFGESHGPAMGGIIDGCPAGFRLDMEILEDMLSRRRPGTSTLTTSRREDDRPRFLSGLTEDLVTLGTPIGFIIENRDTRPRDYSELKDCYRPNHADYTYEARYGLRDHRGGGRSSARETVNWVVGGAVAAGWLKSRGITVSARLTEIGGVEATEENIAERISISRREGDSTGGIVSCRIEGLPAGVGSPVFGKLEGMLGGALMGINGVRGVEYGDGFAAARMGGVESADIFYMEEGRVATRTNHSGGIQGGISNGMPVEFRVAFKPTPSVAHPLESIDREGNRVVIRVKGRHDPCIALRGAVVVESIAALTLADAILMQPGLL